MVQVVMRARGDPVNWRAAVGCRRKDLVAAMPDRIARIMCAVKMKAASTLVGMIAIMISK